MSQSHFISKRFAEVLPLPLKEVDLPVEELNQLETRTIHSVNADIHSRYNNYHEWVEFQTLPQVCNNLPNQLLDKY